MRFACIPLLLWTIASGCALDGDDASDPDRADHSTIIALGDGFTLTKSKTGPGEANFDISYSGRLTERIPVRPDGTIDPAEMPEFTYFVSVNGRGDLYATKTVQISSHNPTGRHIPLSVIRFTESLQDSELPGSKIFAPELFEGAVNADGSFARWHVEVAVGIGDEWDNKDDVPFRNYIFDF